MINAPPFYTPISTTLTDAITSITSLSPSGVNAGTLHRSGGGIFGGLHHSVTLSTRAPN
jgi:hypothetical protein